MKLTIKSFISPSGERFSQLYDRDDPGFPLFYPTAYIARSIRLKTTHGTQLTYLEAIQRVHEWEMRQSCDLATRFMKRDFLKPQEIDTLSQHLRAARRGSSRNSISTEKGNTYISYASAYLTWLANEVITDADTPAVAEMIETQRRRLEQKLAKRSGSRSDASQKMIEAHLTDKGREQLLALWIRPFTKIFRESDRSARLRNVVMLRILYETGMRRGELLALKLKNILESTGGSVACLVIERNHNDIYDTRVHQPVAKTAGRTVPITAELEKQIFEYITEHRALVPGVGFDDEDVIFVTHRPGRGQGKPLSISSFDQVVIGLRTLFPALGMLHPHLLRHDWNFRFSKQADKEGLTPEKEAEIRETLMGWRPDSDMGRRYNKRHIQEKSLSFGLQVAGDTQRPSTPSPEMMIEAHRLAVIVAGEN